jgi:hypothetical protein
MFARIIHGSFVNNPGWELDALAAGAGCRLCWMGGAGALSGLGARGTPASISP